MNTITERLRIDGCEPFAVSAAFIGMEGAGYSRRKFTPTSDVSHLEVYQYVAPSGEKIAIVYDTVAKILTADAPSGALEALRPLLPKGSGAAKSRLSPLPPKAKEEQPETQKKAVVPAADKAVRKNPPALPAKRQARTPITRGVPVPPAVREEGKEERREPEKTNKPARARIKKANKPAAVSELLKGVTRKRLDWALKDLKTADGVKVTAHAGGVSWTLCDSSKNVAELCAEKDGVRLTGVPNPLTKAVRDRLTSKCDMRLLRKYLSVSLRYLSETSRIDLSNGITDLNNVPRLSDYSILLMAPYRALEKLIYDLQQAEGINVKMIGQAYEKDAEGRYTLKKGYKKRIGSVVYAEVMAALYTEYYATRNFYTHSENAADMRSRGISDKADAQRILKNLLAVIEYNCKKLSEINFSVETE